MLKSWIFDENAFEVCVWFIAKVAPQEKATVDGYKIYQLVFKIHLKEHSLQGCIETFKTDCREFPEDVLFGYWAYK